MHSQNLTSWSLRELLIWNKWHALEERLRTSCITPYNWRWEEDAERFEDVVYKCRKSLNPGSWQFLQEIIAAALLTKVAVLDSSITNELIVSALHDQSVTEDKIEDAKWSVVSWVMIFPHEPGKLKGRIGKALVGVSDDVPLTDLPPWFYSVCDSKAARSVQNAIKLVRKNISHHILFRPLLMDHDSTQICGASLGLAVCAGAICARDQIKADQRFAFSGGVTESGEFTEPGYIRDKALTAKVNGFKALICGSGAGAKRSYFKDGVEIIPVSRPEDIEWVLLFSTPYMPGDGNKAINMAKIMSEPDILAMKVEKIDLTVVRSPLFSSGYLKTVERIMESPKNAELFARNLADFCSSRGYDPDIWEYLIKPLDALLAKNLDHITPVAVWHIAVTGWTCADAEGSHKDAGKWQSLARHALNIISRRQEGLECIADYQNRLFVHCRHLSFHFEEKLPESFSEVLSKLEGLYRIANYEVYPVLGRMYGTVAQNHGFCGPSYLNKLQEYVHRAQKAFGEGRVEDFREDWRREFNYLVYGYLDAELLKDAEETLKIYLETSSLKDLDFSNMGRYETAALIRFAADTGADSILHMEAVTRFLNEQKAVHPYQLILFNSGRLLKERDLKRAVWKKSLDVACKLKGARRVLGLLPLSAMYVEELASEEEILKGFQHIFNEARSIKGFNLNHFGGILSDSAIFSDFSSLGEALTNLWNNRHRIFPFTYR